MGMPVNGFVQPVQVLPDPPPALPTNGFVQPVIVVDPATGKVIPIGGGAGFDPFDPLLYMLTEG